MKMYRGLKIEFHIFLTSALDDDDDEWSVSCPRYFIPREEPPLPIGCADLRAFWTLW
jgi:hypothetical protein